MTTKTNINAETINSSTAKALRVIAKELGVTGASKMTKAKLVEACLAAMPKPKKVKAPRRSSVPSSRRLHGAIRKLTSERRRELAAELELRLPKGATITKCCSLIAKHIDATELPEDLAELCKAKGRSKGPRLITLRSHVKTVVCSGKGYTEDSLVESFLKLPSDQRKPLSAGIEKAPVRYVRNILAWLKRDGLLSA